jgi:hypothetical protein
MNSKDFEKILSPYVRTPSEIDHRMREIRDAGMLPTVRGRYAPDIQTTQAVMAVLGLVSRRVHESADIAIRAAGLPAVARFPGDRDFTVEQYLESLIDNPEGKDRAQFEYLEIAEDGEFARAVLKDGSKILFSDDMDMQNAVQAAPDTYDRASNFKFGRILHIPAAFIDEVAQAISAEKAD